MTQTTQQEHLNVTYLGLFANLGMAVAKITGGWLLYSQTLKADGVHSLADSITDLTAMVVLFLDSSNFSLDISGTQIKTESIGAVIIGSIVLMGGVLLGKEAITLTPTSSKSVNPHAMWFSVLSVLVKEILYRKTMKVARKNKSPALAASAAHHRLDSFSSALSLVSIVAGSLYPNSRVVDMACTGIVSALVIKEGMEVIFASGRDIINAEPKHAKVD
ncbi:uncharacterized protein N7500_007990 [Penicillium coprophilum]|uniref:uncharacterized protein n=1 Tax=Penicillium coprophilum TaxID=36646 RepID=UPI002395C15B|nr:uncharacterized protein N7500_007990 [Penicillium coprophilum]KAJ5158339.1 hypothetical protein N7500_007990 [Penicillium coprophilum]